MTNFKHALLTGLAAVTMSTAQAQQPAAKKTAPCLCDHGMQTITFTPGVDTARVCLQGLHHFTITAIETVSAEKKTTLLYGDKKDAADTLKSVPAFPLDQLLVITEGTNAVTGEKEILNIEPLSKIINQAWQPTPEMTSFYFEQNRLEAVGQQPISITITQACQKQYALEKLVPRKPN